MDEFDKTLFELIKRSHPNAKDEEIVGWMQSSSNWATKNNQSMRLWLIDIQQLLRKKIDDLPVDKFFVRLYGILVDIPDYLNPNLKIFRRAAKRKKMSLENEITTSITRNSAMQDARRYMRGRILSQAYINSH